jgi:hypothetical protein
MVSSEMLRQTTYEVLPFQKINWLFVKIMSILISKILGHVFEAPLINFIFWGKGITEVLLKNRFI